MKKILPGVFFIVTLLIIILVANQQKGAIAVSLLESGKSEFPNIEAQLVYSKQTKKLKLASNGTVIHFWATWCSPCVAELPELIDYARTSKQTFYLIAVSDKLKNVKKFLARFKEIPSNVVLMINENGAVSKKMGTFKLPESYIYDKAGKLISKVAGSKKWL